MITHAKVAKLNRYLDEMSFSIVLNQIDAAINEGLDSFELELDKLDDDARISLIEALEVMGYDVLYEPEDHLVQVTIGA